MLKTTNQTEEPPTVPLSPSTVVMTVINGRRPSLALWAYGPSSSGVNNKSVVGTGGWFSADEAVNGRRHRRDDNLRDRRFNVTAEALNERFDFKLKTPCSIRPWSESNAVTFFRADALDQ
ncbi:hypothetical protein EVAR_33477_1 [Eumeta japonica]|uniref:Uncharacterized protein n=1 Tax=Eumeta variegata TaxID=151549 RepID=A0A4C1WF63_EUMVA|nr:hypothetical protein EVAR_33477_1 [Eumeta japonica]